MSTTALLLIDFQNDYFPTYTGSKWPLENCEAAAEQGAKLLSGFREKNWPVIHVRHENPTVEAPFFQLNSEGAQIHDSLAPVNGEPVIVKQQANSFRDTELKALLESLEVENLVIVGAMSNMCIDAVTRAAADFGYQCTVAENACAAMPLALNDITVPAEQVHAAFMAALAFGYARVLKAEEILVELG